MELCSSTPLSFVPYECKWLGGGPQVVAVGQVGNSGRGAACLIQVNEEIEGRITKQADLPHGVRCCAALGSHEIALGDFQGSVSVYEASELGGVPVWEGEGHGKTYSKGAEAVREDTAHCANLVNAMAVNSAREILSAARNGVALLWDTRVPAAPVVEISNTLDKATPDCWSVAFDPKNDQRSVLAGYANGDVLAFDLRMLAMHWKGNVGSGVCSMDVGDVAGTSTLLCTTQKGDYHLLAMSGTGDQLAAPGTGVPVSNSCHSGKTVWCGRWAPGASGHFLTSGLDGNLELHQASAQATVVSASRLSSCRGSDSSIMCLDWQHKKEVRGLFCFSSLDQSVSFGLVPAS